MLHTFVCDDTDKARAMAREPFCTYLTSAYDLIKVAPAMFPAFRQPSLGDALDISFDADRFTDDDRAALMDHAFERYFETAGLFGTPHKALALVESLKAIGVTEVACLIDFGIDQDTVLENLTHLDALRRLANSGAAASGEDDLAIAEAIVQHGVTHLQVTPSAARLVVSSAGGAASLGQLRALLVGGEALPADLADTLRDCVRGRLINMYGPTETTVWSTTADIEPRAPVTIGRPIANTIIRLLDRDLQLVPIGAPGEVCIGGAGVVRGYLGRPDLTAERFITDPLDPSARLYRTGDLARYDAAGALDFIGRMDAQVKISGYRIEPGEIESALTAHAGVEAAVVMARTDQGVTSLAAYFIAAPSVAAANDDDRTKPWQTLWESAYRQSDPRETRFDTAGWTGKLTGEAIASEDMHAWLSETTARVLALNPQRVLEIGCGTGMVLFQLLDHIAHYTGIDLSAAALEKIRNTLRPDERHKVDLEQKAAHELDDLTGGPFDTILLNSVAQYFPDSAYLQRVLVSASQKLAPGGRIFIGDVRWLEALGAFHTLALLQQSPPDTSAPAARVQLETRLAQEPELVLSPDFFHALDGILARLTKVETPLKTHDGALELTAFRFDAVLHFDDVMAQSPHAGLQRCDAPDISSLRAALNAGPAALLAEGLPNSRLTAALGAQRALQSGSMRDLHAVAVALSDVEAGIDPAALLNLHPDYTASLLAAASGEPGQCDVLFVRKDAPPGAGYLPRRPRPGAARANTPYRAAPSHAALIEALRAHLMRTLPAYMIPSAIVMMNAFPLTPNGKIDRKALPAPQARAPEPARTYTGASNGTQAAIAQVWQSLLGLRQVSVRDNIFDMGANSLLTVQAGQRLSSHFGRKISLVSLFRYPTIESLAAFLDAGNAPAEALQPEPDARAARQQSAIDKRRQLRKAAET